MSVISAIFIGKIVGAAATEGLDREQLLRSCGVDPSRPIEPAQMVSSDTHYGLWEKILQDLRSPGFPIRYAKTITANDYGAYGLATKTAATLGEAFWRAQRYHLVLTNSSWMKLREDAVGSEVVFVREGDRRLGMRCANEAAIAEVLWHVREISGTELRPQRVRFRHSAPTDASEHREFFGCELEFDAVADSIEFPSGALDLPLLKADEGLSRFILEHLDRATTGLACESSLDHSLKRLISDALPGGPPSMEEAAKRLGMSRRTLARRLSDQQTSYQQAVEMTRRQLATELLRSSTHSLGEIAFLLGYSEQSAFQRAFKRWTGSTPAEFRVVA